MVYLPPPEASGSKPSYADAYASILRAHRQSPLTSASSVIILVAPDIDALCAARMLADLFRQDDVLYRIIPVSGIDSLEATRDQLSTYTDLHTLILLNMGGILDLPSPEWFGDFDPRVAVHVIDSSRPQNLSSLFGGGENGERIIVWDDGETVKLIEEKEAWEALMYEPEPDSDEDSEDDLYASSEESGLEEEQEEYSDADGSGKRRSIGDGDRKGKRRKRHPDRMSREQRDAYTAQLEKHYMAGTWYGESASATLYKLATTLERTHPDLLWLAILGLTYQYLTSRISRKYYDIYQSAYSDEVARMHPPGAATNGPRNPDDASIRVSDELRFTLFRHWNLYDAMLHSSYVAGKLGIWRERGRKRLTGLLAKMGFSVTQTQQPYAHMDMDLKRSLVSKLDAVAPEYGLVEYSYGSFMRHFGFRSAPMSAADAVESLAALLDLAVGMNGGVGDGIEVEVEGARNGGEWFGGGRMWTLKDDDVRRRRYEDRENVPPDGARVAMDGAKKPTAENGDDKEQEQEQGTMWWIRNFWAAYDALSDVSRLHDALQLSMTLHRAVIQQGASIIDKQDIRTMRSHHVVVLTQGQNLEMFTHPGVLSRLALWLVDALRDQVVQARDKLAAARRDRLGRARRRSLPLVVACLNERTDTFVVVGVMAALEYGVTQKNEFGLAFLDAKERCNARTRHSSFDTSIIEISKPDLRIFLETLCEGPQAM
ncbi:CDC45-like protein [Fistulina hepatica ATCC 64428]|nr:CDC45-like protein [Fistulina hepatica ATCC 64428]